jgi:hypothetical protein
MENTLTKLQLRRYSVQEVKSLLNLNGFSNGQHYAAWSKVKMDSVDWNFAEEAMRCFESIDPSTLDGMEDLLRFMKRGGRESCSAISLVKGASSFSVRVAPSIATGRLDDTAWTSVSTCWDAGQYSLAFAQLGTKGSAPWGCVCSQVRFIRLGNTPELSHKAVDIMRTA